VIKIVIKSIGVSLALLALSGCSSKPSEFQTACEVWSSNNSNGMLTKEMIQEVCSCTDDKFSDIPKKSVDAYTIVMSKNVDPRNFHKVLSRILSTEEATEAYNLYAGCSINVSLKSYKK